MAEALDARTQMAQPLQKDGLDKKKHRKGLHLPKKIVELVNSEDAIDIREELPDLLDEEDPFVKDIDFDFKITPDGHRFRVNDSTLNSAWNRLKRGLTDLRRILTRSGSNEAGTTVSCLCFCLELCIDARLG